VQRSYLVKGFVNFKIVLDVIKVYCFLF